MSAIEDLIDAVELEWNEQSVPAARAELAALRARVAELEQTVSEARRIIDFFKSLSVLDEMDHWLHAHPAPEPPPC